MTSVGPFLLSPCAPSCADDRGVTTVYTMLDFATDLKTCRKLLFDDYFGNPAQVVAPFTASDRSACGHCDNCLRANQSDGAGKGESAVSPVVTRDVTVEAWKVCKILAAMAQQSGKVTLPAAGDLVRGLGKGVFQTEGKAAAKGNGFVDLDTICGGKVTLSKDVSDHCVETRLGGMGAEWVPDDPGHRDTSPAHAHAQLPARVVCSDRLHGQL